MALVLKSRANVAWRAAGSDWLQETAVGGFCNITLEHKHASCDFGSMGAMGLWPNRNRVRSWEEATALCLQKCDSCHRCRYISVSASLHDCSWYHDCDLAHLNDPASADFKTGVAKRLLGDSKKEDDPLSSSKTLTRQLPARPAKLDPGLASNASRLQHLAPLLDKSVCLTPDGRLIGGQHDIQELAMIEELMLIGRVKWLPHRILW